MPRNFLLFPDQEDTPETVAERRFRAALLAGQIGEGTDNIGNGIGDIFRGLGAGLARYRTDRAEREGTATGRAAMDELMGILAAPKVQPLSTPSNGNIKNTVLKSISGMDDPLTAAANSIAGIESGGKYDALGPVTKRGDRAYGKYQVMGANIPEWSEVATGQSLTPEEFLAMPKAQDRVFRHRFGDYLKKYGPQDAASMWFTGKPLAQGAGLRDQLGTSGQAYAQKFMAGFGGNGQMPEVPELATYTPPQPAGGPMGQAPEMPVQGDPAMEAPQPMAVAQQAPAPPMQPASGDAAALPALLKALRNPWVKGPEREFLQRRLDDILKKQDPMYQMGLEKSQLELEAMRKSAAGLGVDEYGLNPQYGVDSQGNPVIMQLSKGGKAIKTPLPDGVSLSKAPIKLDVGTHFVLLDPITRQPVGTIPKELAEAESQKAQGEAAGKQIAAAPSDVAAADEALNLIDQIATDPNLDWGVGMTSLGNVIPGSPGRDFQSRVDQAKSGAFLSAIQQLRGMGSLSNAEGDTATKAVTRLNTATSKEEFLSALSDYRKIVQKGRERAAARIPGGAQAPAVNPAPRLRFNPQTGDFE